LGGARSPPMTLPHPPFRARTIRPFVPRVGHARRRLGRDGVRAGARATQARQAPLCQENHAGKPPGGAARVMSSRPGGVLMPGICRPAKPLRRERPKPVLSRPCCSRRRPTRTRRQPASRPAPPPAPSARRPGPRRAGGRRACRRCAGGPQRHTKRRNMLRAAALPAAVDKAIRTLRRRRKGLPPIIVTPPASGWDVRAASTGSRVVNSRFRHAACVS
jgi:hypothetical protein